MSSHYCRHVAGKYGRLAALVLVVSWAGCATSHVGRCPRPCDNGTSRRGACRVCGGYRSNCNGCIRDPDVWRAGYHTTSWQPLVAECGTAAAAAFVPLSPMLVPFEEELPVPQPTESESLPGGADPAPSIPEPPAGGPAAGSATADPFVLPSIPTACDDPFESDDFFWPPAEPTANAATVCTPTRWPAPEQETPEFDDVITAGWDQPLGDAEFPPLVTEQAQESQ